MSARGAAVLVSLVLVRGLASAQAPESPKEIEAQQAVAQGVRLMDAGKLEEARAAFQKARDLAPDKANPHRLLGVVDFRLGRCKEAVEELETFLGKVGPNDRRVTEVVSMRDKCKEDLLPKLGTLVVESTPPGAEVRLDDEQAAPRGVTPFRDDKVPAGTDAGFALETAHRQ